MTVSNPVKRHISPTHPGEMLREDFMPDYGLTTASLDRVLGVSRQSVNELLRERRSISPIMALRLSRLFGNSPEFWLNAQHERDLWESEQRHREELSRIHPLNAA
ncbi:MAG: HigA family addiction module antidote protein [Candidatus Altiarchaeales archaeon]|nr:HigA family addiction module antidote protein [Candidatus Altiarchaeales archaeon]